MAKHTTYTENTHLYRRERIAKFKEANIFGRNLQRVMTRLNLSISDVAFVTGICRETLSNWLKGNCAPNYNDVLYLCDVIHGLTIEDLYPQS